MGYKYVNHRAGKRNFKVRSRGKFESFLDFVFSPASIDFKKLKADFERMHLIDQTLILFCLFAGAFLFLIV